MAQIPPNDDDHANPLTGNIPAHLAGDVNAALRALADSKRVARFDLLGRPTDNTND